MAAAKKALETKNVKAILPWVPKKAEKELTEAFKKALKVRAQGPEARDLADYWLYETAVRLHREGEGAPYTGLKPAGLDWGPVVPKAEKAIETGDPEEVISLLTGAVEEELHHRFHQAMEHKNYPAENVEAAREFVQAMLGFVLFSHYLYTYIKGGRAHGEGAEGGHEH